MFLKSFALLCLSITAVVARTMKKMDSEEYILRPEFNINGAPHPDTIHEVTFAVRLQNLDKLELLVNDVSDPDSPNYGKYWTRQQVADLISNNEATKTIENYLAKKDITFKTTPYGEFIKVKAKVSVLEDLFDTKFHKFVHIENGIKEPLIRTDKYSLDEELIEHVYTVFHVTDLPFAPQLPKIEKFDISAAMDKFTESEASNSGSIYDGNVFPQFLFKQYNIKNSKAGNLGSQSIYSAIGQSFSPKDLLQFQGVFSLPFRSVTNVPYGYSNDTACKVNHENCIEANLDVQYILAVAPDTPTTYWYDTKSDISAWAVTVSSVKNPPLVHSISYGVTESALAQTQVNSFNTAAQVLIAIGCTIIAASGDDGAPGYDASKSCTYRPLFPASSPYVTAVGATQGTESFKTEIACSSVTGGGITTGGGFANRNTAPAFQRNAIKGYIALKKPYGGYSSTGRGYPDVSMPGYAYLIQIGGDQYGVSGTSASAPVFAGMVSLVNAGRLKAGKSALGWINPAIYKYNGSFANDITSGNNFNSRSASVACNQGFVSSTGWDPVTGFGSVDYVKFCKAFDGGDACSSAMGSLSLSHVSLMFTGLISTGLMIVMTWW
eukprot:gene9123-18895_t